MCDITTARIARWVAGAVLATSVSMVVAAPAASACDSDACASRYPYGDAPQGTDGAPHPAPNLVAPRKQTPPDPGEAQPRDAIPGMLEMCADSGIPGAAPAACDFAGKVGTAMAGAGRGH